MYEYFDFDLSQASFEWDEQKDRINFAKHGIHFKTAAKVFLDPNKLIREDEEHPEELRYDNSAWLAKCYSLSAHSENTM